MEIFDWFGVSMIDALKTLKVSEPDLIYHKIEDDEFIEVHEKGYFLHSDDNRSVIFDVRIYFKPHNDFFESSTGLRGKYGKLKTLKDFEKEFGSSEKNIPALKIPDVPPTLPGKIFKDGARKISAYSENGNDIVYIHVKEAALTSHRPPANPTETSPALPKKTSLVVKMLSRLTRRLFGRY